MNSRSSRPPRSIRSRAGALQAPRGGWRDALTALGLCAGLAVGSSAVPTAKVQAEASPGAGADAAARGRALLRAGQLKDAEAQLKKAAEQRGHNLESLYDLARVHFAAGDYNKSRNACRPLLSKAPDAAYSNLCMAQAFLVFRRATRAAEHVDKARQAEPQLPEVYQVLGDLKRVEGDAAASEAAYQQVLRSRPSDPDAHFGLGQLYLIKPDPAAATQAFRAALSGAPDWPEAQYELGRLVGGSEAVGLLRRVVASRPEWVEARLALGEALLATGDVAQAEPLFREVLKRSPNLPAAHARLGMVLQVRGDLVHAEAELKRGLTGLPNDADASLALARVYAQSDRPDDAFEAYRQAASLERTGSRALVEAGSYALSLQRNTLAQGFLEKAVDRTPGSAQAQARLAEALAVRGEKAKARTHYQRALEAQGPVDRSDIQRRLAALEQ